MRIILLVALFLGFTLYGMAASVQAQNWVPVPLGTGSDILDVDATFGPVWVVGRGGFVATSSYDHTTWTTIDVGTSEDLYSKVEPCGGDAWISGANGIVRVFDGSTWNVRDIPGTVESFHLYTSLCNGAMAVGSGGSIYRSTDNGVTWTPLYSASVALHSGTGAVLGASWVVGDNGTILKSTDSGVSWVSKPSGTHANLYSIVNNYPIIITVGTNGTILKSTDGGETWSPRISGTAASLRAIHYSGVDASTLLAAGDVGTVLETNDQGETWCPLNAGTSANLYGALPYTNQEFFVGGAGGLLLRSTNSGGGCPDPASIAPDLPPAGFSVLGPEPFPAREKALIGLRSENATEVQVQVFDLAGRQVASTGPMMLTPARERELTIDTHNWTSGMYWVRIHGAGWEAARRLLVLR